MIYVTFIILTVTFLFILESIKEKKRVKVRTKEYTEYHRKNSDMLKYRFTKE